MNKCCDSVKGCPLSLKEICLTASLLLQPGITHWHTHALRAPGSHIPMPLFQDKGVVQPTHVAGTMSTNYTQTYKYAQNW